MISRVERYNAFETYDVKVKYLGDYVEIIEYANSIKRLKKGIETPKNDINAQIALKRVKNDTKEIRYDNINRSFSLLLDLSRCNYQCFTSFITLTFKENMKDLKRANRYFNQWVLSVRRTFPMFKYLCVPEFQKRGAIHYHLMTNIVPGSEIAPLQKNTSNMYDVKFWKYGFTSVFDLKLTDSKFSVALYLAKYFYKDIDNRLFGHRKILYSQNLTKPTIQLLKSESHEFEKILKYVNDKKSQIGHKKSITTKNSYASDMEITIYK